MRHLLELPPTRKHLKDVFLDPWRGLVPAEQLNCVAHMILVFDDPVEVAQVALDYLMGRLGTCRGDLGFATPQDLVYAPAIVTYNSTTAPLRCDTAVYSNRSDVMRRSWRQEGPVACDDVASHPFLEGNRAEFLGIDSKSILFQRLTVARLPVGMICLDFTRDTHHWSQDEKNLVARFARNFLGPLVGISRHWNTRNARAASARKPTDAELDAIRLAAAGLGYAEIGERLGKSARTIENQLRSARVSLQAVNRTDLVRKCELWL